MDELQALMGEAYQEGMTVEQIGEFFKGKNFADLSSGKYVSTDKYNREINTLQTKLTDTQNELNTKLTDDEKNSKAQADRDAELEQLKQLLATTKIEGNKDSFNSTMASTRELLGIEDNDSDFTNFMDSIVSEDRDKTLSVAKYVSKIVKSSYEKGKNDATKDSLGNFGKGKGKDGSESDDDMGTIGKKLANIKKGSNKETYDYFK